MNGPSASDAIASAAPAQPRWFQFSLGSMLAAATLASGILAVITLREAGRAPLFYSLLGIMLFRATRPRTEVAPARGAVRRFWRRQFVEPPTANQLAFDVLFGIVLPVFCLWGDFVVFKSPPPQRLSPHPVWNDLFFNPHRSQEPLLGQYAGFIYALTAVQLSVLLVWLVAGQRLRTIAGLLGGILLCGSTTALLLGLVLFPFATAGLALMFTGALGYTPLLTAFVYYRQGRRALRLAQTRFGRLATIVIAAAAGALVIENLWMQFTEPAATIMLVVQRYPHYT